MVVCPRCRSADGLESRRVLRPPRKMSIETASKVSHGRTVTSGRTAARSTQVARRPPPFTVSNLAHDEGGRDGVGGAGSPALEAFTTSSQLVRDDSVARRECTWRLKVFFRSDDTSDVEPHVEHLLTT